MNKLAMDTVSQTKPLHFLTVTEASRLMETRALSPVDLVEAFLARIEAVDGRIHSYITVLAERARKAAATAATEIAAGRWKGPLHGIPFAVKDNYHVTGVATTGGSRLMADYIADDTSTIVGKLEQAGAILLGKLNTWEYGTGNGQVYHDLPYEVARNPWDLQRFTGGSSTGAGAAVAAGTAMFALGSDTGGSIRLPAAACGVQGLKATFGRISRAGCIPNCWSLDHTGPLCWTVEDSAIVLQTIAGHDSRDPTSVRMEVPDYRQFLHQGVKGLVIGVVRDLGPEGDALDAANATAIEAAAKVLEELGAILRDVRLPAPLTHYRDASKIINWSESLSIHERDFTERNYLMGQALREKMMSGFMVRAVDYIAAMRLRKSLAKPTDALVRSCDALLLANAFHIAPRFDAPDTVPLFTSDTASSVFNMTGHPALSICTGFDSGGVPLNAQIVGRYFDETTVLRIAQAFENATPWRDRRPDL
jgi:aspartyl-tRNA(Asn)/glutamyl-tRNA(Gln) amidotransferase subunit A